MDIEEYSIQYKEFIKRFKLIRHEKSLNLDNYILMKDKQNQKNVIVKNLLIDQQEQIEDLNEILMNLLPIYECNNIVKFLGFSLGCKPHADLNIAFIIFECNNLSLDQLIQQNVKKQKSFDENWLWNFLDGTINALQTLEKYNLAHEDIHPRNFFLRQEGIYKNFKLFYSNFLVSSYKQIKLYGENYYNYYLSPEQLDSLANQQNDEQFQQYNKIKSSVFSLGMMLLHLGTILLPNKIYKTSNFQLNGEGLQIKLSAFRKNYSAKLYQLLEHMIQASPDDRKSYSQLYNFLKCQDFQRSKQKKDNRSSSSYLFSPEKYYLKKVEDSKRKINCRTPTPNKTSNNQYVKQNQTFTSLSPNIIRNQQTTTGSSHKRGQDKQIPKSYSTTNFQTSLINQSQLQETQQPKNQLQEDQQSVFQRNNEFDKVHINLQQELYNNPNFSKLHPQKQIVEQVEKHDDLDQSCSTQQQYNQLPQTNQQSMQPNLSPASQSPYKGNRENNQPQIKIISPKQRYEEFVINLENQIIYDENKQLKQGMIEKLYVDGSMYVGEILNEQRHGKGIYYYKNGEVYAGDWLNNKLHGQGIYIFTSGEKYQGFIIEGKKEGKGQYFYQNGNVYEGEWKNDKKHGFGIYQYYDKNEKYEGQYFNGLRQGQGIYYFANGDIFQGNWINGQKCSQGIVTFADQSKFVGEWKEDIPNGYGKMVFQNGDIYEGYYSCGIKEGDGIYIQKANPQSYEGQWNSDHPQGYGIYHYTNGDVYKGGVLNGKRNGDGEYKYCNGDMYLGGWINDKKNGNGQLQYKDGSFYTGEWLNNQISGQGKMVYDNGDVYEGEWFKDKKQGNGAYQWVGGGKYIGKWENDFINGKGIYINPNGQEFKGQWKNNQIYLYKNY